MRQRIFMLALLAFLVSGVSFAQNTSEAELAAPPLCDSASERAEVVAEWNPEVDSNITIEPARAMASPPPCPTSSTCVGGSNRCGLSGGSASCQANGPTSTTDTGQTSCTLPGGQVGHCIFGTIKIYVTTCGQCPCCSTSPACFCPLNCGQATTWGCA